MRFVVAVAFTFLLLVFVATALLGFGILAVTEEKRTVFQEIEAFICFGISTVALSGVGVIGAIREATPVAKVDSRRPPR